MLYIFSYSISLPSQSVQLLLTFFCFESSIETFICTSLCIATALFTLLFFSLYIFLPFLSLILSYAFFASFFSFMFFCTYSFDHHVSLSPLCFPNVTPSTVSGVFLSISAVLSHSLGNHQVTLLHRSHSLRNIISGNHQVTSTSSHQVTSLPLIR